MLSTAHTLISLPFGVYLENPIIIFAVASVFHLFADTVLHWNVYPAKGKPYPLIKALVDVTGGIVVAWLLVGENILTVPILAAIAGGNFPDVLQASWELASKRQQKYFPRLLQRWFVFHEKLQHETTSPGYGLIPQVVGVILAIYLVWLA